MNKIWAEFYVQILLSMLRAESVPNLRRMLHAGFFFYRAKLKENVACSVRFKSRSKVKALIKFSQSELSLLL